MFLIDDSFFDKVADRVLQTIRPELYLVTRPELVDADTLARLLSVSRPTVDRLRRDGVIPSIPIGPRCRRFNTSKVIAALERHHGIIE
ncbi:Helix-turn-helix domain protein [Stieleria magnilauensis]|uniref:Helix-turn-helix domain protein n=1 Tax=Stieleria magnilauensis TaxID=2527963 RepID=A0ABX5XIK8_9BACT|nr:Helix-turn-helix domain protein [Planctomycetes bacterium TBK1r]